MRRVHLLDAVRVLPVKLSEAAAERDVLLARDFLSTKQQYAVIEKGLMHSFKVRLAQVLRQVEADDLRAQRMG